MRGSLNAACNALTSFPDRNVEQISSSRLISPINLNRLACVIAIILSAINLKTSSNWLIANLRNPNEEEGNKQQQKEHRKIWDRRNNDRGYQKKNIQKIADSWAKLHTSMGSLGNGNAYHHKSHVLGDFQMKNMRKNSEPWNLFGPCARSCKCIIRKVNETLEPLKVNPVGA